MPIKTKYVRYYYGVIIKDQPFNFVLTEYLSRFGHDIFKGCFCPDEDRWDVTGRRSMLCEECLKGPGKRQFEVRLRGGDQLHKGLSHQRALWTVWSTQGQTLTHLSKSFLVIRVAHLSRNKCTATWLWVRAGAVGCRWGSLSHDNRKLNQMTSGLCHSWDSVTLINGLGGSHHFRPLVRSHFSCWLLRKQMPLP